MRKNTQRRCSGATQKEDRRKRQRPLSSSSMSIKAVLFCAGKHKYDDVLLVKRAGSCLDSLQSLVGGRITVLSHKQGSDANWVAYARENGLGLRLPPNYTACGTLRRLGFTGRGTLLPGAYFGDVVLCRNDAELGEERSLMQEDVAQLATAHHRYAVETGQEELTDDEKKDLAALNATIRQYQAEAAQEERAVRKRKRMDDDDAGAERKEVKV